MRNPTVKIGRLLAVDDDWIRVGGNTKGYRWTHRPSCERHSKFVANHGAVRRDAAKHGITLAEAAASDSDDTIDF